MSYDNVLSFLLLSLFFYCLIYSLIIYDIFVNFRAKEKENSSLQEQIHAQSVQSEKAIQDFKTQVEKNQIKVYDDMKKQVMSGLCMLDFKLNTVKCFV